MTKPKKPKPKVPPLLKILEKKNKEFAKSGGCPSCKSTSVGVHYSECELSKDDLY